MNDYNFGNFLCMLREKKNLTQADIAKELGVTTAAVSKWENGSSKPRVEALFRLTQIFDVRLEELIAGHYIEDEKLNPEVVNEINERYEYLRKIDSCNAASVKLRRAFAWIIDWNIFGAAVLFLLLLFMVFFYDRLQDNSTLSMVWCVIILLYPVSFVLRDFIFGGSSIGKKIMGLVVLDKQTGLSAEPAKLILRNVFLPLMYIDLIVMLVSGITIGDRVAHTVVVPKNVFVNGDNDISTCSISKINSYSPPKHVSTKRTVFIVIVAVVLSFALLFAVTALSLSAAKDTEEYKIAYQYFIDSETFKKLNAQESGIIMNHYSRTVYTSIDNSIPTETAEIGFIVNSKSFEVICHKENDVWQVCDECTNLD